jgi:hypothetical protein
VPEPYSLPPPSKGEWDNYIWFDINNPEGVLEMPLFGEDRDLSEDPCDFPAIMPVTDIRSTPLDELRCDSITPPFDLTPSCLTPKLPEEGSPPPFEEMTNHGLWEFPSQLINRLNSAVNDPVILMDKTTKLRP